MNVGDLVGIQWKKGIGYVGSKTGAHVGLILEKDNQINIFFDNNTFDLIGWQTKDVYQNLNITFFSSIKKNHIIDKNLFKLPLQN